MTTSTAPATLTGTYRLDPTHSRIGFVARHAMVTKVRGSFKELTGTGTFDVEEPSRSSLQLTIEVASMDTANPDRDGHLRSNDFLDLEHYPQITFTSTSVTQVEPATHRVTGGLAIKGATRPVTFDLAHAGSAVDLYGNQRVGLEGSTTINRKDWGVNRNAALEAGGVLVSEKVALELDISAIKDAVTAA